MDMSTPMGRGPKMKLVMVGNGMAGVRTLEELLKLAPDLYDITVFGAEPHPNYNRILLSPVLAGEQAVDDIVLNPLDWYADNGIALHLGKKVVKIDRSARFVESEDGTRAEYDRLLLATGSTPFILPVPGADLEGVIGFRDIADVDAMIRASSQYRHAVVIGGGLLGLEAANGLMKRGMDVTVVHIGPWLMERQLDEPAARLLQKSLEEKGMKFLLQKQTAELVQGVCSDSSPSGEGGRVAAIKFKDGDSAPADLVVMAVGIRPNTALAESSGLHCNRGIVVNDTLQTFDPRIYSIGECAAHRGIAYGLVAPLFEQAKVCANHLAHYGIGRYQGSVTSTKLKVTGIDLFSAGNFTGGEGTESILYSDPIGGIYKKLVIKDNKLIGGVMVGDTVDGAWYFSLLRDGKSINELRDHLMFGQDHCGNLGHQGINKAATMTDDMEVCGCNGVCKGDIVKAIREKGLFTLEDVRKHTKASGSCGSCTGLVEQILAVTAGGDYSATPKTKSMCSCTDHTHEEVRAAIRQNKLLTIPQVMQFMEWRTPNGCASCRPALNYYLISTWPGEAEDLLGDPAHVGRQHDAVRVAPHRRRRRQVQHPGGACHRRPAYRPARNQEGRPAESVGRPRHAVRSCLRQGAAHGEDLRRIGMVPLRHPEFDADGHRSGKNLLQDVGAAQGQARRIRMPAQLRRSRDQGRRHHRCRFRLGNLRGRQRRHQDRGRAIPGQGENPRRGDRVFRRLPAVVSRGSALPRPHRALRRARRTRLREKENPRRRRRPPRAARAPAVRTVGRTRPVAGARQRGQAQA